MKKVILIIIFMTVLVGASYYMGSQVNKEIEYIETIIDLTDSEKKQIEQDATLNWMPLDSAWALVDWALAEGAIRWEVKDSTHWSFKDSTRWNVKDSIPIYYVPVYVAEDTIVTFDETDSLQRIRVQLSLAIKPRFFPTYNKFLTETQLRELTITQPERVESWWAHRWVVYAGYGFSYSQRTYADQNSWCWSNGFQLGIGVRLY